jgi:CMP-N-acetylneuraminic acid synthetase
MTDITDRANDTIEQNEKLQKEVLELKKEVVELKEHLKKYTSPQRYKKYYEENKEKIIEQKKAYNKKKNSLGLKKIIVNKDGRME